MGKWKEEFSREINNKTGLYIGVAHIHPSYGREYYIPEAESGKPLFLHHYRGPFFVDIPQEDYKKLESGQIMPKEYIESARWYFGHYWGGESMYGGYFMPLEDTTGIHEQEKIYRYMKITACKGAYIVSGYRANKSSCESCIIENCPFSKFKGYLGCWEKEIPEKDKRMELENALSRRMKDEFGRQVSYMTASSSIKRDEVHVTFTSPGGHVAIIISDEISRELLYNPLDRDWNKYAKSFKFISECSNKPLTRRVLDIEYDKLYRL